jgi:hypothetical protein
MANELAALTVFTTNLFRHAYFVLPWLCRNLDSCRCQIHGYETMFMLLSCLKKNRPMFFGPDEHLSAANERLSRFYDCVQVADTEADQTEALRHYGRAWLHAWRNRLHLQLRGNEARLMRFFYEIACKGDASHLPELMSMARCVDKDIVGFVRSIIPPDGFRIEAALKTARVELSRCRRETFGCERPDIAMVTRTRKHNSAAFKACQNALREFKRVAHLRIVELFDERNWHPTIDSATLHIVLKNEGLEDYLPYTFRGRVGVQPAGYPLTFYTYGGLELEKPPLNDVRMNVNYGTWEEDKDYGIHPVSDGTY